MALLELQNITAGYDKNVILKDLDFQVEKGELVSLLGSSGCGKTTTLRLIAGFSSPMNGKFVFDGKDYTQVPLNKRNFGFVFQSYALFPHMTVFDNIAFSLSVAHRPKDEIRRKVEEGIRMVHLEGQEHKFPSQLSGGQQQRVAIARSVVMEPGLLLLDEPLSNLDTKLRTEMRYELKQIHNRLKRASVYVTHDQSEALALSDKIVIMKLGKVQQIGTPKQVFLYPANRFVADFMGYKNIWDAKILSVEESGNIRRFQVESSGIPFMVYSRSGENEEVEKILIQAYQKGEEVLLASRPDDILAGTTGKNDMNIRVEGTEYLGTTIQVTGSIKEGMDVQARIEPNTFVKEGTALSLTIQPDKLLVLPKDKEE